MFTNPSSNPLGSGDDSVVSGEWEIEGNTLSQFNGEITENMTLVIPAEVNGVQIKRVENKDADSSSSETMINILGTLQDTSVTNIIIEDGIQEIGECAFAGMEGLTGTVRLPDSVEEVDNKAFSNTNIDIVTSNSPSINISPSAVDESAIVNKPTDAASGWEVTNGKITRYLNAVSEDGILIIPSSVNGVEIETISGKKKSGSSSTYLNILNKSTNNAEVKTLIISPGIRVIDSYAFQYFTGLQKIILPDSIEVIGEGAFMSANINGSIFWSENITTIGDKAFDSCAIGDTLVLPNDIISIGSRAFYNCGFIGILCLPDKLQTIGSLAFSYNKFNGDLIIPNSVTSMGTQCFYINDFDGKLKLSSGLSSVADKCFDKCYFTEIEIPEGVEYIGTSSFYGNQFTTVIFPDSLISIGQSAFNSVPITGEIFIPNNVTEIKSNAFSKTHISIACIPTSTNVASDAFYNSGATIVRR